MRSWWTGACVRLPLSRFRLMSTPCRRLHSAGCPVSGRNGLRLYWQSARFQTLQRLSKLWGVPHSTCCSSAEYFSIGETPHIFPRRSWRLRHFISPPPPLGHPPIAIVLYYLFRCLRTVTNLHRGKEVRTKEGSDTLLNLPRSAGKGAGKYSWGSRGCTPWVASPVRGERGSPSHSGECQECRGRDIS